MAIPQYFRQVGIPATTGSVLVNPRELVQETGFAGLARAAGQAGELGQKFQAERDEIDAAADRASASEFWLKRSEELRQGVAPDQLPAFAEEVGSEFDAWSAAQLEDMSPGRRRQTELYYQSLRGQVFANNFTWAVGEHGRVSALQLEGSIESIQNQVLADPDSLMEGIAAVEDQVAVAARTWASPSQAIALREAGVQSLQMTALEAEIQAGRWAHVMTLTDPARAAGEDPRVDELTVDQRMQVYNAAEAAQKRAAAEARAAAARARSAAAAELRRVGSIIDAGFEAPQGDIDAAVATARASGDPDLARSADWLQERVQIRANVATMTPAEIESYRQAEMLRAETSGGGYDEIEVARVLEIQSLRDQVDEGALVDEISHAGRVTANLDDAGAEYVDGIVQRGLQSANPGVVAAAQALHHGYDVLSRYGDAPATEIERQIAFRERTRITPIEYAEIGILRGILDARPQTGAGEINALLGIVQAGQVPNAERVAAAVALGTGSRNGDLQRQARVLEAAYAAAQATEGRSGMQLAALREDALQAVEASDGATEEDVARLAVIDRAIAGLELAPIGERIQDVQSLLEAGRLPAADLVDVMVADAVLSGDQDLIDAANETAAIDAMMREGRDWTRAAWVRQRDAAVDYAEQNGWTREARTAVAAANTMIDRIPTAPVSAQMARVDALTGAGFVVAPGVRSALGQAVADAGDDGMIEAYAVLEDRNAYVDTVSGYGVDGLEHELAVLSNTYEADDPELLTRLRIVQGLLARRQPDVADAAGDLDDVAAVLAGGRDPGAATVAAAVARASRIPDLAAQAGTVAWVYEAQQAQRAGGLQAVQGMMTALRGQVDPGNVTADQARRLDYLTEIRSEMVGALRDDPIAYMRQRGLAQATALPDGQDPDALAMRFGERMGVAQHFGVDVGAIPWLTEAERDQFTASWAAGGIPQRQATLAQIRDGFGDYGRQVAMELADSEPLLAHLVALQGEVDSRTVTDALVGLDVQVGDRIRPPYERRVAAEADTLGGAFVQDERLRRTVVDTAEAIAHARYARGIGSDSGLGVSDAVYQRALVEAAGGRYVGDVQVGGPYRSDRGWVTVPDGITTGEFDDLIDELDRDILLRAGLNGRPVWSGGEVVTDDDIDDLYLQSVGEGQYMLLTEDPSVVLQPAAVMSTDGGVFIFDLTRSAVLEELRRRAD